MFIGSLHFLTFQEIIVYKLFVLHRNVIIGLNFSCKIYKQREGAE